MYGGSGQCLFISFPLAKRDGVDGTLHCVLACGYDLRNLTLVSGWGGVCVSGTAKQRSCSELLG